MARAGNRLTEREVYAVRARKIPDMTMTGAVCICASETVGGLSG
jgi:hypothetical protein